MGNTFCLVFYTRKNIINNVISLIAELNAQVDILARRYVSGFGQQQGGLVMHFENKNKKDIAVSYYQAVPWFMKLYFHTLKITQNGAQIDPNNCKYQANF